MLSDLHPSSFPTATPASPTPLYGTSPKRRQLPSSKTRGKPQPTPRPPDSLKTLQASFTHYPAARWSSKPDPGNRAPPALTTPLRRKNSTHPPPMKKPNARARRKTQTTGPTPTMSRMENPRKNPRVQRNTLTKPQEEVKMPTSRAAPQTKNSLTPKLTPEPNMKPRPTNLPP